MKARKLLPDHFRAVLTLFVIPTSTSAMSGMDMPHGGPTKSTVALSKSMGEPISSSESEIEITYSADGKTTIFVSGQNGSPPSAGAY